MVTGRTDVRSPEYSPTSEESRSVRVSSSCRHCRLATMLVVRISVCVETRRSASMPIRVLPAPQGSTRTPLPPPTPPATQKGSAAATW